MNKYLLLVFLIPCFLVSLSAYSADSPKRVIDVDQVSPVGTHVGDFEVTKLETPDQPDLSQITEKYQRLYTPFFGDGYFERAQKYYSGEGFTEEISVFWTDGCSSSPDGLKSVPNLWRDCCLVHDIAYWRGGPEILKIQADAELNQCLNEKIQEHSFTGDSASSIYSWLGDLAENSVAFGGGPQVYAPWRWGYGWNYYIGYERLTDKQDRSFVFHLLNYMKAIEEGVIE